MSCCEPMDFKEEQINGKCPDCGSPTVDSQAFEQCGYSPVECETCNSKPCDGSC